MNWVIVLAVLLGDPFSDPTETVHPSGTQLHLNDDVVASFGNTSAAPDCRLEWDTAGAPDALQLWCTDIDGAGTDGVVCYVDTGTDDLVCNGSVTAAGFTATGDVTMGAYDIKNPDDIYCTAPASDVAPRTFVTAGQPVFAGVNATNTTGGSTTLAAAPGAENLTGVTKANTAGDTVTFAGLKNDGTTFSVTLTEGDGTGGTYECDGAASDIVCVCNLYDTVTAHATLSVVVNTQRTDGTCSDERLFFGIVPGTSAWLTVTPSDAVNTVVAHGTDGDIRLQSKMVSLNGLGQISSTTDGIFKLLKNDGSAGVQIDATVGGYLYLYRGDNGGNLTLVTYAIAPGESQLYGSGLNVIWSGNTRSDATATGDVTLSTGNQTNAGNYSSGNFNLYTGATTTDGDTGDISIYTGAAGGGAADSGDITFTTNGAPGAGTTVFKALGASGTVDTLAPTQADLTAGSCTAGQIAIDTGGATKELCLCAATNTWYCWSATTLTGPTD